MHAFRAALVASVLSLPALGVAQPAEVAGGGALAIGDTTFPTWTLEIAPSAWYVSPGGKGRLPGSTASLKFEDLNLDSPRWSPQVEARFRSGRLGLHASGMHFEVSDRSGAQPAAGTLGDVSFAAGDVLSSSFEFTSIELLGSYQLWGRTLSFREDGGRKFAYSLDALLGARFYDVEQRVASATATDSGDGTWIEPVAGARLEMEFHGAFGLDVRTDFGTLPAGGKESFSWDIAVTGTYRPLENVGIHIGYRQLLVRLHDGDDAGRFSFNGAMAGLFAGASVRF